MADPKQEETFKVIDRRLFSEDGALRKDVVEEEERREEEAAARAANRAASNPLPQPDANKAAKTLAANPGATAPASAASGDNQQPFVFPFVAKLVSDPTQQTLTEPSGLVGELRLSVGHASLPLGIGFSLFRMPRGQQFIDFSRSRFDLSAGRQRITRD